MAVLRAANLAVSTAFLLAEQKAALKGATMVVNLVVPKAELMADWKVAGLVATKVAHSVVLKVVHLVVLKGQQKVVQMAVEKVGHWDTRLVVRSAAQKAAWTAVRKADAKAALLACGKAVPLVDLLDVLKAVLWAGELAVCLAELKADL